MSDIIVLRTTEMEKVHELLSRLGLCFKEEKHGSGPRHYACEANGVVFEIYPSKKNTSVQFIPDDNP